MIRHEMVHHRSSLKRDANCRNDWKVWLRSFETFAEAVSLKDDEKKLSWMLHYAGPRVQTVYASLPDKESDTTETQKGPLASGYTKFQTSEYDEAVLKLCSFFEPKQNVSFERHIFHQMTQGENERIDMFLMRLREQAERCNFESQSDDSIRHQITSGCSSNTLSRKILERGDEKLDTIIRMAQIFEVVEKQQKSFGKEVKQNASNAEPSYGVENPESVCQIQVKKRPWNQNLKINNVANIICGRCGLQGHKASDEKCPAKGKTCNNCGRKDHFARRCFMRGNLNTQKDAFKRKPNISFIEAPNNKTKHESVQMIDEKPQSIENEYEDVFMVDTDENDDYNTLWCNIGGIDVEAIVDSGTKRNIIDRASWLELKAKHIQTSQRSKEVDFQFRGYGGHELKCIGKFTASVQVPNQQTVADFYVAYVFGKILIGFDTAKALGVLKIGYNANSRASDVNAFDVKEADINKPKMINRFGKIKGVLVEIPLKPDVKGVIQPYRRVPAPLEKLVDDKIDEMLQQGIIEKVEGVSKWVSGIVVAPKDKDDIRICIDMRRANLAVEHEHHPLPTMEDFLPHLGEAKIFSKLDVKQAFHQVEISPGSREITTFMTRKGLYRYTRLMFGITCAPEIFQKLMEQILSGCEGVIVFIDDIVVFAPTRELHDLRLRKVLERIREFNVTLNKDKCKFAVSEITFNGHRLSGLGIKPLHDKLEAVRQFREPHDAEEVRSFLGLVNYVSKFIPNLATISEPLRRLTRKDIKFDWGIEQQIAFDRLKHSLSDELTLGYYNVKCPTQVIADASPVGLGAVLLQTQNNESRIISYASRSLTPPEQNYAQTEKEALALVWAVERFHYFLFGRHFAQNKKTFVGARE